MTSVVRCSEPLLGLTWSPPPCWLETSLVLKAAVDRLDSDTLVGCGWVSSWLAQEIRQDGPGGDYVIRLAPLRSPIT
jgi:hypothetical protein